MNSVRRSSISCPNLSSLWYWLDERFQGTLIDHFLFPLQDGVRDQEHLLRHPYRLRDAAYSPRSPFTLDSVCIFIFIYICCRIRLRQTVLFFFSLLILLLSSLLLLSLLTSFCANRDRLSSQAEDHSLNLRRSVNASEMTQVCELLAGSRLTLSFWLAHWLCLIVQDVYQRQPLLSSSSKGEGWETGEEYTSSSEPTTFYDSKGSSSNGSRGHHGNGSVAINGLSNGTKDSCGENGIIRIDMPAPHREEPKYPREYIKTLVGEYD